MNTFDLILDLDKSMTPAQVVRIRQDDHDGTTINAIVYDHGERIDSYVFDHTYFCMRLPDGAHYYRKECNIQSSGQQSWINVIIDEQEAASVAGRSCNAYFAFELNNRDYSTGSFMIIVEPSATSDASAAETYDSYIEDAIERCNEAAEVLETLQPLTNTEIDAITD